MTKLKKRYSHFVFDLLFLSNVASPQPILSVHAARLLADQGGHFHLL